MSTRRTSLTHPDHIKLDPRDRLAAVVMLRTGQWTDTAIAAQLGVSRKTVGNIAGRWGR